MSIGLAGEDIPFIARIISVADSFSAMTTSRAYRKALETDEAIRRLQGGAGTQLDPRLVELFVTGLATVADAPMPGADPPCLDAALGAEGRRMTGRPARHSSRRIGVAVGVTRPRCRRRISYLRGRPAGGDQQRLLCDAL